MLITTDVYESMKMCVCVCVCVCVGGGVDVKLWTFTGGGVSPKSNQFEQGGGVQILDLLKIVLLG